jgi:hypothetical protein
MVIHIINRLGTYTDIDCVPNIGDIVTLTSNGGCFQLHSSKTFFGVNSNIPYYVDAQYPSLNIVKQEWKIIGVKAIYPFEALILLKNRINQYIVFVLRDYTKDYIKLIRRGKNTTSDVCADVCVQSEH